MSVHYKFKSALEYDTVTFDGLHISVADLKNAIIQQKRIGKGTDFDLQVTNAQTKEVYEDESTLIPKNTSLLIARIPTVSQAKSKQWEGYGGDQTPPMKTDEIGPIAKTADLSSLDAPEDDKIKAMMSQSTQEYDPSNYQKIRGANQMGVLPANYRCYKCHQTGHWIKDCTLSQGTEPVPDIKKSTGIPQSFMVPVEGPQIQGAMMTPNGSYAVPVLDHQAYNFKPTPVAPVQEIKPDIPEDLLCSICSDLLTDAVMIPCCGNSFCDECIRSCLLESEDEECPDCHDKGINPGTLIPNRFLRKSVANFKNTTGYIKKPVFRPPVVIKEPPPQPVKEPTPPPKVVNEEPPPAEIEKPVPEEKTVPEEKKAEEVEQKNEKDIKESEKPAVEPEPPAKAPPAESPKKEAQIEHTISKRVNSGRERSDRNSRSRRHRSRDSSPRHHRESRRRPSYEETREEDRPGTPTVDEPGMTPNDYYNNPPQPGIMMALPPMQGPPPNIVANYPPGQPPLANFVSQPPPPNFRMPPPGPGPYLPPGAYPAPPRPIFDAVRPPLSGPPPFPPAYPPGSRHRDYGRRNRTPPGLIEDPLAAFNRMLREKDERERRAKQRMQRRSYSRSRSHSRSYSPRSPRRMRSRSPLPRRRSRSRSFSLSRSSRSYSGSPRGSPYRDRDRNYSPRHSPRRGPPPARYRSPIRSPPRRYKEHDRGRERDSFERDRNPDRDYPPRDDRPYRDSGRGGRDMDRDRERDYRYYNNYDDRAGVRSKPPPPWAGPMPRGPHEGYFNPPPPEMNQPPPFANRYPPRDYQYMNKPDPHLMPPTHLLPPIRKYEDIGPPGVEEPPVPGLENSPRPDDRYHRPNEPNTEFKDKRERYDHKSRNNNNKDERINRDKRERSRERSDKNKIDKESSSRKRERSRETGDRKKRSNHRSRSTEQKSASPKKQRNHDTPEKHKKKKRDESTDREKSDHDKRKDGSDDEKSRKSKEKKKRKEKEKIDKKKRKDKREKHKKEEKEKKPKEEVKEPVEEESIHKEEEISTKIPSPIPGANPPKEIEEIEHVLYDDHVLEVAVVETPVKPFHENHEEPKVETTHRTPPPSIPEDVVRLPEADYEEGELDISKEYEDSEKDILELHSNDLDLKTELDSKIEMLAPLPEKSKWEVDDDSSLQLSPSDNKFDSKSDKSGKVTNEVLKRAENAIFAKAINAIRPIEIKKISGERAKFYSGEKEVDVKPEIIEESKAVPNIQVTIHSAVVERKKPEAVQPPVKLPVKERLGIKVNDPDKVINLERSLSPFSRRHPDRNYAQGERRVDLEDRRRRRSRESRTDHRREHRTRRSYDRRTNEEKSRRSRSKIVRADKKKRSRTRSESEDRKRKKKDKKTKKEKTKKKEEKSEKQTENEKPPKSTTEKRKTTVDEANFEPDYDLESESDKEKKKPEKSSTSESSDSSSEEERRKKKHRKHKKKRSRKDSASSSSDSDSDSSEDEKEKRRKKHKKKQKKKKKSKHK